MRYLSPYNLCAAKEVWLLIIYILRIMDIVEDENAPVYEMLKNRRNGLPDILTAIIDLVTA